MFVLEDYLPYLLNRAGSHIATSFSQMLRGHGITLPVWRVLAALRDRDGQRVGQLAGHTSIEVSTLSRLIGTMEAKGLARRERAAADDARAVTVHMTERGRELAERIVPVALYYEEVALRGLTEAEADTLKGLLRRVYDNMTALDEAPQAARQPAEARRRA